MSKKVKTGHQVFLTSAILIVKQLPNIMATKSFFVALGLKFAINETETGWFNDNAAQWPNEWLPRVV